MKKSVTKKQRIRKKHITRKQARNRRKKTNRRQRKAKKTRRRTRRKTGGQDNTTVKQLFGRTYSIQDVDYDGDCMYHSILRATRANDKEPGTMRDEKGAYWTPKVLRKYLAENVYNYSDITEQYGDMLKEIVGEIKNGIKDPGNPRNWGSEPVVQIVNRIFDIDIQIVDKSTWKLMWGSGEVTDDTILLLWVNGAHYMWLKEENKATAKEEKKEENNGYTELNDIWNDRKVTDEEAINMIRGLKNVDLNNLVRNRESILYKTVYPYNYYTPKFPGYGLPVINALVNAGANPNQVLRGVKVVGDEKIYNGETALDLLVKDYKHLLDNERTIKEILRYDRNADYFDKFYVTRLVQQVDFEKPKFMLVMSRSGLIYEQKRIQKETAPKLEKELTRLGEIIDYLSKRTKTAPGQAKISAAKIRNSDKLWDMSHPTQGRRYNYSRMKISDFVKAIREHDLKKVKDMVDAGIDVNQKQSDNREEKFPVCEAITATDIIDPADRYKIRVVMGGGVNDNEKNGDAGVSKSNAIQIVKLLINSGAKMDQPCDEIYQDANTPLQELGLLHRDYEWEPDNRREVEQLIMYAFQHGATPPIRDATDRENDYSEELYDSEEVEDIITTLYEKYKRTKKNT